MKKLVLVLTVLAPVSAQAGGVHVGEAGSQAMERAGAFVAKADDPTALSINPAGLAKAPKVAVYLVANLLDYSLTFKRSGTYAAKAPGAAPSPYPTVENDATFQPVPYLAGASAWGPVAFGGGLFAPSGFPN